MSTRSAIVHGTEDHYEGVYVHHDGYPEHMVPQLLAKQASWPLRPTTIAMAVSAVAPHGYSQFHADSEKVVRYKDAGDGTVTQDSIDGLAYIYRLTDSGIHVHDTHAGTIKFVRWDTGR